ncbi:MAG: Glu/Leu/Phe/Val dehydrogenase [Dehalococcoidia bacterium]
MQIFDYMEKYGYEELVMYTDKEVGLRAFVCIHDTTLGPAVGGTRMWPFATEEEALRDVLRLAKAMTYKSSLAGLDMGGGKALIIGDPNEDKTEALFRAHGRFIDTLGGRFITTEDVGIVVDDIVNMRKETRYASGLPESQGGLGGAEVITGYGIYRGAQACCKELFGSDSLGDRTVAIQGFGKVAYSLAEYLKKDGAKIITADINETRVAMAVEMGATVVGPEEIYDVECDIFSPCALGGVLNSDTIPRIKAPIVAGAANNQLLEDAHAEELKKAGILYAPDYAINPGGIITVACELGAYGRDAAMGMTGKVYDTLLNVFALAKAEGITTAAAADHLAEERISNARKIKNIYRGNNQQT